MNAENINSIIKVLNGGIEFYETAVEKVDNTAIAGVFKAMILARKNAIVKLQPFAKMSEGERETGSALGVKAREIYTNVIGLIADDKDHAYIEQLEEVEDATLAEIKDAMEANPAPLYASTLREVYLEMKQCHDRMLNLQRVTA